MNCLASCGAPAGRRLFPRLFLPLAVPARLATAAFATAVFLACLLAHGSGRAADWPQILGSARNGVAANERLAEKWPADGPPRKWKIGVGSGYAGPAVVGTTVVVFHRVEDKERVQAVHLNTGKTLWTCDFLATYRGGVNADRGPRCVPLIHGQGAGGRVYVFGAAGDLHCLRLQDGKKLWSRSTYADFQGDEGFFGAGSSPILLGNRLLLNVGGRVAGLVAFDPETGKVLLDGVPLVQMQRSEFRKKLAFVPQDPVIFADTVMANIRFGWPEASDAQIVEAAKAAAAHEFITDLPNGYETYVGERGIMLSGGQKQRLAIARAILRNAPVLMLDEATSALDAESERAVQTAVERLATERTTLIVAHRLATVKKADRIVVLDKGRVVDQGTHEELVRKGGLYARLAKLQFTDGAAELA